MMDHFVGRQKGFFAVGYFGRYVSAVTVEVRSICVVNGWFMCAISILISFGCIDLITMVFGMNQNDYAKNQIDWFRPMKLSCWFVMYIFVNGNECRYMPGRVVGLRVAPFQGEQLRPIAPRDYSPFSQWSMMLQCNPKTFLLSSLLPAILSILKDCCRESVDSITYNDNYLYASWAVIT